MIQNSRTTQAPQTIYENLFKLKNEELHTELRNRVSEERKLTHQILQLIVESTPRE